jgi:hypothetical protein
MEVEMRVPRTLVSAILAGSLILTAVATVSAKSDNVPWFAGQTFVAHMTGAQEAPGPGDPDGHGVATIVMNYGQGTICWRLTATDIAPATAAHIHIAPAGAEGPVVLPLSAPTTGESMGCASGQQELIKAIRANPAGYYVNVHNVPYPAGAIRGQLG